MTPGGGRIVETKLTHDQPAFIVALYAAHSSPPSASLGASAKPSRLLKRRSSTVVPMFSNSDI